MAGGLNWLVSLLRRAAGGQGTGDPYMTADRALTYAPVKWALKAISGKLGELPINLHQQVGRTNVKITDHAGYATMRVRPNSYQTPFVFKQQMMVQALMWGNGRAYIHKQGPLTELVPLMGDRCETMLVEGEKVHFYKVDRDERLSLWEDIRQAMEAAKRDGTQPDVILIPDSEVIHIQGFGFDGVQGKSLLEMSSQSWAVGLGAESQERSKQRRGYSGGLMLEAPPGAFRQQKDAEEFLRHFRESHDGEKNSGKTGMLREGITAKAMAMTNIDAQFLEQRKFQRQEIMLHFNIPFIPGDETATSYNSLEQKNLSFRQDCIGPWLRAWEEELDIKLLTARERAAGMYFKFNDAALLRGDMASTAATISTYITSRVMSPNEAREKLDMNPYEGGDEYANPSVTPGAPGASGEEAEPPETRAMRSRLEHLVTIEGKQMVQACKAKNFVDKVDKLCDKWAKTWAKDIGEEMAVAHCEESKELVLACADNAKDESELAELVAACVATWAERVESLIDDLEVAKC